MTTKNRATITVRVDPGLHARLTKLGEREERSVNWLVNKAIEQYLVFRYPLEADDGT